MPRTATAAPPGPRAEPARPAALLLPLALAACGGTDAAGGPMELREVRSELLFEGEWEVVAERPDAPVRAGALVPSVQPAAERAGSDEMPALVLPPPASARIEIGDETGAGELELWAGLDRSVYAALPEQGALEVAFEVRRGGVPLARETVVANARHGRRANAWTPLVDGDGEAIQVRPGDVLELSTEVLEAPEGFADEPLDAGFGGLAVVRRAYRARAANERGPSLVLIVMDTLRADRLGAYGCPKDTSPHADALARRGALFEEAHATSSWTWPSTASILTGLAPQQHGVTSDASCYLAERLETLPEALQRAGFTTAAFSANPLIVPAQNFDQGFETFDHDAWMRKSDEVVPAALDWLEAHAHLRFLLYLHLVDPHTPHEPRPEDLARLGGERPADFPSAPRRVGDVEDGLDLYQGRLTAGEGWARDGRRRFGSVVPEHHAQWMRDAYDACVATGDHWVGAVLERLEELDLADDTIVCFTSDHGEELLDHGLLGHGHSLHRELVRVPLILAGPGVPPGVRVPNVVSNRHLAPTLARLLGVDFAAPDDALDLLELGEAPQRVFFSTERGWWNGLGNRSLAGVRDGGWTLHRARDGAPWGREPGPEGDARLFHVELDPGELEELAAREPERAAELSRVLERRRAALVPLGAPDRLRAGEATLDRLRTLGYIDRDG